MVVHILESKQQLNPSHSFPQSQESSTGCCLVNQWNQSQLGGDFSQFPIEPGGLVRAFMFPAGLIQCAPTLKMLKVKPATCINLSGVENMAMAAMSQNHGTLFMHPN